MTDFDEIGMVFILIIQMPTQAVFGVLAGSLEIISQCCETN